MSKAIPSLIRGIAVAVVCGIALCVIVSLWNYYMNEPWTRDSRVRAHIVQIAPDVSGYLEEINIVDNQLVEVGDILFTIDKSRYELALKQAQAVVANRKARMEQAEREVMRYDGMRDESIAAIDREKKESDSLIAIADYEQAIADEAVAQLNLNRTTVVAPVRGYIANADLRKGTYEAAGQPLFALVAADSFYVAAYMEETKLHRVNIGDKAIIRLMGTSVDIEGHVESIARGIVDRERTDSPSMLADVNPTFSWVRLAQRIPVRVKVDRLPEDIRLVAGQTATVTIKPAEKK